MPGSGTKFSRVLERYAKLEGPFLYSKESYNNFLILIQTEKLGELTKARQAQDQL